MTRQAPSAIDAFGQLMASHAVLRRELDAELAANHELRVVEYEVLLLLSKADGRSMRRIDLAEQVRLSPSGITRLLDRLEHCDLVGKAAAEDDARVTFAVLTDKGLKRLKDAEPAHRAAVERLLSQRLDREEIAALADLLERVADGADASCSAPE